MFRRHKLFVFAAKAAGSVIGLALVWTLLEPYYSRILVPAANRLVMPHLRLVGDGGDFYFYSPAGEPVMGIHGAALYFGLILLLALLIAVPGLKIRQRLKNIGIGLAAMFAVHLFTLVALAKLVPLGGGVTFSPLSLPMVLISSIGLNLVPVLVWAGICWRKLFGRELPEGGAAPVDVMP